MRRLIGQAIGQAAGHGGRGLHLLARIGFTAGLLLVLAALALGWRLSQGPILLPWLVDRLEASVNADGNPTRLRIGQAALAWEGFSRGIDRPIDIVLTDLAILDRDGRHRADLPRAALSLSMSGLLFGEVLPRAIVLDGLRLRGVRAADGTVVVDLGTLAETIDGADAEAGTLAVGLGDAIALLASPAGRGPASLQQWRHLTRLQLRNASAVLVDRALGVTWQAPLVTFDLRRAAQGGAAAEASLRLVQGDLQVDLAVSGAVQAGGNRMALTARTGDITPSRFAAVSPVLAPLAAVDLPMQMTASASLGSAYDLADGKLTATLGTGRLQIGRGVLPVRAGQITLAGRADAFTLTIPRLELAAGPTTAMSSVTAEAAVRHADQAWTAKLRVGMDKLAFTDLHDIWPDKVGGKTTKIWLAENVTDGIAHKVDIALDLRAPDDLSDITVTALSGGLEASNITVHWLRPIPPLVHGVAKLNFLGPDALAIDISAGQQSATAIAISNARLVISGLSVRDQVADLSADITGPAADQIAILKHPRLHLFDTRPLELRAPSGTITGKLAIIALPLEDNLTVEQVKLRGSGVATDLHLGGVAAGRDLDHGQLTFEASNEGLTLRGTADLAGVPTKLLVEMDFRAGGPSQVIQKVNVTASTEIIKLATLGLDASAFASGGFSGQAEWISRRNKRGEVSLRADLAGAALAYPRLGFAKPAGQPATLEARLQLDGANLVGVDRLTLTGSGIDVRAQMDYALGRPQLLRLQQVRFGALTDLSGDIVWPRRDGDVWAVTLNGSGLDASGEFGTPGRTTTAAGREDSGPPWSIDAHIDRVLMGEGRTLFGVAVRASNDGRITRQARVAGRTQPNGGAFEISINPATNLGAKGRDLRGTADDAGGLIAALDVIGQMRGGKLVLSGLYDDSKPDHPLSGTAEITDFRMHDAPAIAKLLQAITVYGIFEAVQSRDLGFSSMTAPFSLIGDILEVQDARAYSASLGMTGRGRLDLARRVADTQGTVVPAYFLNSLLGRIPLLGNLLSAEKGGGLLAIGFSVRGPFDDPAVLVNPLTAVTPGFLRRLFNIFDSNSIVPPAGSPQPSAPPQAAVPPKQIRPPPAPNQNPNQNEGPNGRN